MVLKRPIEMERNQLEKNERELDEERKKFIRGGGLVSSDIVGIKSKEEWTKIVLRIKSEAVMEIDALIGDTMGVTRTGWILQAIEDKLKRVENEQ